MNEDQYWQAVLNIFQFSMGPSALALTLGMILGALTNRLQFLVSNVRHISKNIRENSDLASNLTDRHQMLILHSRVKVLQASMLCVGTSILLLGTLIGTLFLERLLLVKIFPITITLFIGILGSMIIGVALFLVDVRRAHKAVEIEIQATLDNVRQKTSLEPHL